MSGKSTRATVPILVCLGLMIVGCSNPDSTGSEKNSERIDRQQTDAPVASPPQEGAHTVTRNSPPVVVEARIENQYVHRGVDIRIIPEAIDRDGDYISYRYAWSINGEEVPYNDRDHLPGDQFKKGDRVSLQIVPTDGKDQGPTFFAKDLIIPNAPPRFLSQPPAAFKENVYHYEVSAEDPDGEGLIFSLVNAPQDMLIEPSTGQLRWEIKEKSSGPISVTIAVQDEDGMKAFQQFTLSPPVSE
jgi:hypothetical protein